MNLVSASSMIYTLVSQCHSQNEQTKFFYKWAYIHKLNFSTLTIKRVYVPSNKQYAANKVSHANTKKMFQNTQFVLKLAWFREEISFAASIIQALRNSSYGFKSYQTRQKIIHMSANAIAFEHSRICSNIRECLC